MSKPAGALIALLALVPAAQARVHAVNSPTLLTLPGEWWSDDFLAHAVAIDGGSIIAIVDREGARRAVVFRRGSDGQWAFDRVLMQSTAPASQLRASLAMKNGLIAIDIDGVTRIWERSGNTYSLARTDGEIRLPGGHAISGRSILIGATGCSEDGLIYEKSTDGVWRVTGRLPSRAGVCGNQERDVELNYNFALINDPAGSVHAWARNGTNLDWRTAGDFELQGTSANRGGALALQNSVAVAPGSTVYRRTSNTVWTAAGSAVPMTYALGFGDAERVWYRDGLLLTAESDGVGESGPHAYVLDANGRFQHVAIFQTMGNVQDLDISGNTVVSANVNEFDWATVAVYEMPMPRVPPDAIANDFNARDVSGFQTSAGSGFAIAGNRYDSIYRQSNAEGEASAVLTDSNWSGYQGVQLHVRPTAFNGSKAAAGVALRYVDEDNYLAILVDTDSVRMEIRRDGVTEVLNDLLLPPTDGWRYVDAWISGNSVWVDVDEVEVAWNWDITNLPAQGRVALVTRQARADFDNLHARPTMGRNIFSKRYDEFAFEDHSPSIVKVSGTWVEPPPGTLTSGLRQTNTTGLAIALSRGPAIGDLTFGAVAQLDAWGSTSPVPWFGVVARYQDPYNHYYLSVRGTNQLQIRKIVNGVTTVLDATSHTATAGREHLYQFQVEGNQLHASVDGKRLLWAIDDDLKEGLYGIATYRTAATYPYFSASQR